LIVEKLSGVIFCSLPLAHSQRLEWQGLHGLSSIKWSRVLAFSLRGARFWSI
jgi:hypothetical protein